MLLKYEISRYLDKKVVLIRLQKTLFNRFVFSLTNIFNCKGYGLSSAYKDEVCWSSKSVRDGRSQANRRIGFKKSIFKWFKSYFWVRNYLFLQKWNEIYYLKCRLWSKNVDHTSNGVNVQSIFFRQNKNFCLVRKLRMKSFHITVVRHCRLSQLLPGFKHS